MRTRRPASLPLSFLLGLGTLAGPASAQLATPVGAELAIDAATATGRQRAPRVAGTTDGGFLVVWAAEGAAGDDDGFGVQLTRLDATGAPLGTQHPVNSGVTAGDQIPGGLAALSAGGHVVVWESAAGTEASRVRLRRIDASGDPLGAELGLGALGGAAERSPTAAALAGGGFVVAWTGEGASAVDTDGEGIEAKRCADDGSPLGAAFQVNSYTSSFQRDARVAARADGGFTVAWLSDRATPTRAFAATNVVARRFGSAGQSLEDERIVSDDAGDGVGLPRLAVAPGAELVIWEDERNLLDVGLRGRWSDAGGEPFGAELAPTAADVDDSAVARSPAGATFAIVWSRRDSAERGRVEVEPVGAGGGAGDARLAVDADDARRPDRVDVAFLGEDRFVTVWDERDASDGSWRIRARRLALLPAIFADGFESGDPSRWSSTAP